MHVRDQRPAVELDESLVDAAHPPALAAGEHDAGDVGAPIIAPGRRRNRRVAARGRRGGAGASTRNRSRR